MELTADMLVEKIDELKQLMDVIRGNTNEPKVNVEKLVESLDEDQMVVYKKLNELVIKLDRLFHANYDSTVAQIINQEMKRVSVDANARTQYLVEIDNRAKKLELEGDVIEMIETAKNLKNSIIGLHMFLVGGGVDIPDSVYKTEDGKIVVNAKNEKVLNLPRIFDVSDEGEVKKAGRPSRSKTLILGTVDEATNETTWHDHDHVGKTFVELYGTIRSEHNAIGLFKEVEKSNQAVTTGWETPVHYAGRLWVGKTRS